MSEMDTHDYCFVCLGEEHAVLAIEKGGCEHCDQVTVKMLRSRLNYFQSAPALPSWGSRMDLHDEQETGPSLSLAASPDPHIPSGDLEARSGASSVHEGDDVSLGSSDRDQPASEHSSREKRSVEELLEVVTRAVARLQLDWPREQETPKQSKLEDRFLSGGREHNISLSPFSRTSMTNYLSHGVNHILPVSLYPRRRFFRLSWVRSRGGIRRCHRLKRRSRAISRLARHLR
ncbi:hypothetical protein PO909_003413 [Leuciscus waleckii]